MKQYDKYKDSGVKWIGEIPSHWKIKRLKNLSTCNNEVLLENMPNDYSLEYVEIGDVSLSEGIKASTHYLFNDAPSRARRITQINDIIISTVRTYLQAIATITRKNLIVSTGFAVIRPIESVNASFLSYALKSSCVINWIVSESIGVNYPAISANKLVKASIPIPSLSEQCAIVSYLDTKVGKIDKYISVAEKKIVALEELKQTIIADAVTHGTNPNAKMKDSSIKWIGEIPSHWEVRKLKYLTSYMQSGTNLTSLQITEAGKYPVYGGNGIRGYYKEKNCNKKCIVIGRQGALCGNVHLVKIPFWATDHAVIAFSNKDTDIDFLYYLCNAMDLNQYASQTAAQPGIAVGIIKNVFTCLPSLSEQHAIVSYLDHKVSQIDKMRSAEQSQIAILKEYKQRLISDVVTGKIKVQ